MKTGAPGGDGIQSLRIAAGLCLASPVAACLVLPDGRLHICNELWRAQFGAQDRVPSAFSASLGGPFAGTSTIVEANLSSDTVALSLVPVRSDETNVVVGVLVSALQGASAAQQLDSFKYTLSHDLLSPLRTLQEMAGILEREHIQRLPPDASIFLSHVSQGANKLADRVEALVHFVRLSAQPLNCRRVDVTRLVNEVLTELRALHGDKATVIVGKLPDAHADADLVRQLFSSVLSNAFKFTRNASEPRIEIGSEADAGRNTYFVVDNGVGFDMKYAGKLFGLFQRMHGEAQFEGTGAGLASARRIVERHGGTIRAEAKKDQGAKLSFTLPSASTGVLSNA
jgi:light-regulated signal transduction histidine kinase (bacteriophytochrome)